MALVVWQITADDWPHWRSIRLRALRDSPEAFGSRLADIDDREDSWRSRIRASDACFLAHLDDVVVGMVAVDPWGAVLELQSMFVPLEARGRGIGRELVEAVVRHARTRPLYLAVVHDNTAARAMYERVGFRHDGAEPDDDGHLIMQHQPTTEESTHAR